MATNEDINRSKQRLDDFFFQTEQVMGAPFAQEMRDLADLLLQETREVAARESEIITRESLRQRVDRALNEPQIV